MTLQRALRPCARLKYFSLLPLFIGLTLACRGQVATPVAAEFVPTYYERIDTITVFDPVTFGKTVYIEKKDIYSKAAQMPVFKGCPAADAPAREQCSQENMLAFIRENLEYPEDAQAQKLEGTAIIRFIVYSDGKVDNYPAIEPGSTPHQTLHTAAMRVIRMMPDFQPGMQDGQPVHVEMVLPVVFELD